MTFVPGGSPANPFEGLGAVGTRVGAGVEWEASTAWLMTSGCGRCRPIRACGLADSATESETDRAGEVAGDTCCWGAFDAAGMNGCTRAGTGAVEAEPPLVLNVDAKIEAAARPSIIRLTTAV